MKNAADHPHQCHLCPFNGINAPGKPYNAEAAAACLECAEREDIPQTNGGVCWVHMDAAANPATVYGGRLAPDWIRTMSNFTLPGHDENTADWVKSLYSELADLNDLPLRLLVQVAHRVPLADVARHLNIKRRTAREVLRGILTAAPHIRAAFHAARRGAFTLPEGAAKLKMNGEIGSFNGRARSVRRGANPGGCSPNVVRKR